jgi:hypothetical protein
MAAVLSYPHPVLGNADDVTVGRIDPEVTFRATDEIVTLNIRTLVTANPTLDELLRNGSATWRIRVQCARTYFRHDFLTCASTCDITLDGHDLDGRVDVDITLFTANPVPGYLPVGAHLDYGTTTFNLAGGEVLGTGPVFSFDVDKEFDPLRAPVASIMRISKGEHEEGPFRVVLEDEFIELVLSQQDWNRYAGVKERAPGVLHVALVVPALTEALRRLTEFAGRRWADRLRAIVEAREVDVTQPVDAAQILLNQPLARAFDELNVVLERDIA